MWRMLRVGRILICVHTTNKDCLLLHHHPFPRHILAEDEGNGDEGGNHATEKSARVVSQHLS